MCADVVKDVAFVEDKTTCQLIKRNLALNFDEEEQINQSFEDEEGFRDGRYGDDNSKQQYQNRRLLSRSASSAGSRSSVSFDDDGPMPYSDSAAIQSKKYMERDQVKLALEQEERQRRLNKIRA
ncbi:Hypothetical protein PHPALM_4128, partial [Phytophthora palmivora]